MGELKTFKTRRLNILKDFSFRNWRIFLNFSFSSLHHRNDCRFLEILFAKNLVLILNQKTDLDISLSLLKTGERDSIFHFLFSIWLFGILSMPDHINLKLWFHWKVTLPKQIDFICNRCEMNTIWNCAPFFKALPLWAGLEGSSFPATGAAQTVTQPLHLFWLKMICFDWILIV